MFFKNKKEQTQRDRILSYKKAFSTQEGKEVLYDLMNRFHVLNKHDGSGEHEGQRSVVLFIMNNCNINMIEFDKLLKGEEYNDDSGI